MAPSHDSPFRADAGPPCGAGPSVQGRGHIPKARSAAAPHIAVQDLLHERRLGLIETATHTATWTWDAVDDALQVSPALADQVGTSRRDAPVGPTSPGPAPALPGRLSQILQLATDRDRAQLALMIAAAWKHGASFEVNHHVDTAGSTQAVRHVGTVITGVDGSPVGMVGAVSLLPTTDENDPRSDAEVATRHRNLVRVLPSAVIVHQDGIIVAANPAAYALVSEAGPVELVGTPIMDLVAPESRRPMMERVLAMSAPGAIAPAYEEELLLPTGARIPVEVVSIRTTWAGRPAAQAVISDVRERKALLERLTHDATRDALTGLGNRRLIDEKLRARLAGGEDFATLFVDLDKFKDVNDSYGHEVGDQVLIKTVDRLRNAATAYPGTFVGRLSGDEFLLLTPDVDAANCLAARICDELSQPLEADGWEVVITASVGVVRSGSPPYEAHDAWDVVRDADVAMYRAKQLGQNRWVVFDETMRHRLQRRVATIDFLRRAVADPASSGLHLVYQPIVNARTGRPRAVEALIRWNDTALGNVFPDEFIPLAEETGLIVPLGHWILRTACEQLATWRREHPVLAGLQAAINLSPRQLADPDLIPAVASVLADLDLPAQALCLEITETALADDIDTAYQSVSALSELGVVLSIDDFGTGYSSLAYLRNLPVDELKVDRSFVSGLGERIRDEKICASVISMAHLLGLKVVAEGIETRPQLEHLRDLGCDYIQGYFTCRPQGPNEVIGFLLGTSEPPST